MLCPFVLVLVVLFSAHVFATPTQPSVAIIASRGASSHVSQSTSMTPGSIYPGTRTQPALLYDSTTDQLHVISGYGRDASRNMSWCGVDSSDSTVASLSDFTTDHFTMLVSTSDWSVRSPSPDSSYRSGDWISSAKVSTGLASDPAPMYDLPGGRIGSTVWWVEEGSLLGLYSGLAYSASSPARDRTLLSRSDLWLYDLSTSEWMLNSTIALVEDSVTSPFHEDVANWPPARSWSAGVGLDDGSLIVIGGKLDSARSLADVWKWEFWGDSSNGNWTRMWGSYPYTCVMPNLASSSRIFDPLSTPGSRFGSTVWKVNNGTTNGTLLYTFGGVMDYCLDPSGKPLSDLWSFDPLLSQFAHIISSTQPSSSQNPVIGVYDDLIQPPSRSIGLGFVIGDEGLGWVDSHLVLFGGKGTMGWVSDVWVFDLEGNQWGMMGQLSSNGNGVSAAVMGSNDHEALVWDGDGILKIAFDVTCDGIDSFEAGVCSGHGFCQDSEDCLCRDDFEGALCENEKRQCNGIRYDLDETCSGHGDCLYSDLCECTVDRYGQFCSEWIPSAKIRIDSEKNDVGVDVKWHLPLSFLLYLNSTNLSAVVSCSDVVSDVAVVGGADAVCEWYSLSDAAKEEDSTDLLMITFGTSDVSIGSDMPFLVVLPQSNVSFGFGANLTITGWPTVVAGGGETVPEGINYPLIVGISVVGVAVICAIVFIIIMILIAALAQRQKVRRRRRTDEGDRKKHLQLLALEHSLSTNYAEELGVGDDSVFDIVYDDLVIEDVVSATSTATVYRALRDNTVVCFKCYSATDISSMEQMAEFESEISVLKCMSHPNLLRFIGACYSPPKIGIVSEWCDNGDLKTYILDAEEGAHHRPLRIGDKLRILAEVASAMGYLHSQNITHRDLKTENILLTGDLGARIIDFGLSRVVEGATSTYLTKQSGSSQYMAPEVTLSSKYSGKCDVYSFSIIMFEVLTGEFNPYNATEEENVEIKVALNPDMRPKFDRFPLASVDCLQWYRDAMERCWDVDVEQRHSFHELLMILRDNSLATEEMYPQQIADIKVKKKRNVTYAAEEEEVAEAAQEGAIVRIESDDSVDGLDGISDSSGSDDD